MRKYILISLFAFTGFCLTACLKDKNIEDQIYGMDGLTDIKTVIIPASKLSGYKEFASIKTINLPFATTDTTIDLVAVRLSTGEVANHDLEVVLDTSYLFLKSYNDSMEQEYEVLPSSIYSLPNGLTVKIPKGSREGSITIKLKPSNLVGHAYGFGFKIKSVSDPSYVIGSNYSNQVVLVGVKNKYDAVYRLKGYHNRVPYNYPYDTEISMITTNSNSVAFYWDEAHDFGHPIGVGPDNDLSWYGNSISPVVSFDPVTNLVTGVSNQGSTPITMFTGAGSGVSKFDPASRTIYVYWNYNNRADRAFLDTLTFVRER